MKTSEKTDNITDAETRLGTWLSSSRVCAFKPYVTLLLREERPGNCDSPTKGPIQRVGSVTLLIQAWVIPEGRGSRCGGGTSNRYSVNRGQTNEGDGEFNT